MSRNVRFDRARTRRQAANFRRDPFVDAETRRPDPVWSRVEFVPRPWPSRRFAQTPPDIHLDKWGTIFPFQGVRHKNILRFQVIMVREVRRGNTVDAGLPAPKSTRVRRQIRQPVLTSSDVYFKISESTFRADNASLSFGFSDNKYDAFPRR